MSKNQSAKAHVPAENEILKATEHAQARSSDPSISAWVSANAGTGKTTVLTRRVLRLMLTGTPPERILCLTYTKTAAAEMSKRVFKELASWVTAPNDKLTGLLATKLARPATPHEQDRARALFASAIETPGGLKVQTIHAFCERLLQRFPLEAGVTPGFRVLDEDAARALLQSAIDDVLADATDGRASPLNSALSLVIAYAADESFDDLLRAAVRQRAWLESAIRGSSTSEPDAFRAIDRDLRRRLDVGLTSTEASLLTAAANVLSTDTIAALRDLLATGGKTDLGHATTLTEALAAPSPNARRTALSRYFLTGDGDPRKSLMTATLKNQRPDLDAHAASAQDKFSQLIIEAKALEVVEATVALQTIASSVLQRYTNAKAETASLDFDDLITKSKNLLSSSDQTAWVLYKLDGGLDHILVDEAQDTSPDQWAVIEALAAEFHAGSGTRDEAVRTIFAVGDEKQSIYSFQGAEPEMFAHMGRRFSQSASEAAMTLATVPLTLSFRSVTPILDAVDHVFADRSRTPGLTADASTVIRHAASRVGHAGLVEIWPTETHGTHEPSDVWSPLEDTVPSAPANRLANKIADAIQHMHDTGEELPSQGRKIRWGDILILVRKRNPFAVPMVKTLKDRGIPVAGADRMALTEQIAVMDLIALGDFLLLPEDDLALACVLKSPLIGLDDDDLMAIAPARKGTLWNALLDRGSRDGRFRPAADTLKRWRARADFIPPYEFFASVLDREGGRARILARLGPEAADALDEFLDMAIAYDDADPPSLTGFLTSLRAATRDVKRDMELSRDEVRIMTVHGAKGLESPIVFLADTCTTNSGAPKHNRLVGLAGSGPKTGAPSPFVWVVKGAGDVPAIRAATNLVSASEQEELNRLLYVAMTRAEDRLYIAGFEGKKGRAAGCWYDLIDTALKPATRPATRADGTEVRRIESAQIEKPKPRHHTAADQRAASPLPAFATTRAPAEPQLTVPLAPSRLEDYTEPNETGDAVVVHHSQPAEASRDNPSPLALGEDHRFLRGTITHALLQVLPDLPQTKRASAAKLYVDRHAAVLGPKVRSGIVSETLALLSDPAVAHVFSLNSRAEVPVAAEIAPPNGRGPALIIRGEIDRLLVEPDRITIVDYKTNRNAPADVAHVPAAYLFQLAAYARALEEIYSKRNIVAVLIWTAERRVMPIPEAVLNDYRSRLWELRTSAIAGEGRAP